MSYPCHYTNLCPHKPHKHAHTHTHTHACRSSLYFITTFLQNNEDMTLLLSSASSLHSLALFIASSSNFTEHSSPLSNEEWECMCLLGLVSLCVWARLCLFLYVIIYVIISVQKASCTFFVWPINICNVTIMCITCHQESRAGALSRHAEREHFLRAISLSLYLSATSQTYWCKIVVRAYKNHNFTTSKRLNEILKSGVNYSS